MESVDEFETGGLNSIAMRGHNYLILCSSILAYIAAIVWWPEVETVHLVLFFSTYILCALGITVGYHRYFTHHGFKCKPWLAYVLLILGTMSGTGPLLQWVRTHVCHHRFVDEDGDPHSPGLQQHQTRGKIFNFWYSHVGWLLTNFKPNNNVLAPQDKKLLDMVFHSRIAQPGFAYYFTLAMGIVIPGIIAGLWSQSLSSAALGMLWGGFLRIAIMLNLEFAVNSSGHMFGARPFDTKDTSTNSMILGIVCFGEGWHNNHHQYPYSARHGLKWWQFDSSYYTIYFLKKYGIAWDVKLPVKQRTNDADA